MSTPIFSSPLACERTLLDRLAAAQQGHAAAGQNAFFDRRTRGVQGVFDAGLLLLHFGFGAGADRDDRHAAGELGQPLLELLLVVLALGRFDLVANLLDAVLDVGLLAGALDDRRVVLVDRDLLGPAQLLELEVLELEAQIFADQRAAGEHGDVAEHGLAAIAEAGRLDGADVEHAAELVDDQRRQRFAFDIFGDDQQRLARLGDLFQQRHQLAQVADLLLVNQDQRVFEQAVHLGRTVDEVGRDVALVELHALDELERRLGRLAFFDGDHAVLADLLHGVGQQLADLRDRCWR